MPRSQDYLIRAGTKLAIAKQSQTVRWPLQDYRRAVVHHHPKETIESAHAYAYKTARTSRGQDPAAFYRPDDQPSSPPSLRGHTAAVKDNFVTGSLPTTCASDILHGFQAPVATCVRLLERAGARIVATTNMDEFGMGSHSTNSAYGAVFNGQQYRNGLSAGGSSGGSAILVADKSVDFALGSDTGGSVRLPAAYTKVIGFKPSYGRISRQGLIPYANSLDTVGIFTNTCDMLTEVFESLDFPDATDPTCLTRASRLRIRQAQRQRTLTKAEEAGLKRNSDVQIVNHRTLGVRQCRVGIPMEYNIEEVHPAVRETWMQALGELESFGHELTPISLPTTKQALSAYYVLAPAEAASNLAKYDGVRYGRPRNIDTTDDEGGILYAQHRGSLFGDEVKRRILLGSFSLSAGAIDNYFIQAQKVRRLVQNDFNMVFRMAHPLQADASPVAHGVDFIVCPTAPTPPPLLRDIKNADPVESYMNDVFTVPASLAGLPAISVPSQVRNAKQNSPENAVGIQIIGQYGDDREVIRFAKRFLENQGAWEMKQNVQRRPKFL